MQIALKICCSYSCFIANRTKKLRRCISSITKLLADEAKLHVIDQRVKLQRVLSLFTFIFITNVNKNIINMHVRSIALYQLQSQLAPDLREQQKSTKAVYQNKWYLEFIRVSHFLMCKLYAVHVYDVFFTSLKQTGLMFMCIHVHTVVCTCMCAYYTHTLLFPHGEQVVKYLQMPYCSHMSLCSIYQVESSAKGKGTI